MRIPLFYSPSQLGMFISNRREYYLQYLCDKKAPKIPQTEPMAIGGAFDSHLKRALAVRYYGREDSRVAIGGEYDLSFMLNHAIESHLDFDKIAGYGYALFKKYCDFGWYNRLISEIDKADPKSLMMEGVVRRVFSPQEIKAFDPNYDESLGGFELYGKPDICFTIDGVWHIYDAKVNGFFSSSSPIKGHVSKSTDGCAHKDCILGTTTSGIVVDISGYFDSVYNRQIGCYNLCLGGSGDYVAGIEQISCREATSRTQESAVLMRGNTRVAITCASSRVLRPHSEAVSVMRDFAYMHDRIKRGWIFDDLSLEENNAVCRELDLQSSGFGTDSEFDSVCGR